MREGSKVNEVKNDMEVERKVAETAELENESSGNEELDLDFSDDLNDDIELPDSMDFDESVQDSDPTEEDMEDELEEAAFDFSELVPSVSKPVNRIPDAGVLSVVNSKNGNRVSIASEVNNRLNEPNSVQVGFTEESMVIGQYLGEGYTSYDLKGQGTKRHIYSKELVEQITSHYQLDFRERTSITFSAATYQKLNGNIVAVISMK
ncbi:hypothetical protein P4T04_06400 [Bacillus badius]|uniref:hypothetical protein n=1 Tax=Bacillus badius TaxID=1455 RepID=UPI002E1CFAF4|nr:hypothetical protein [Bacillus badius]